MDDMEDRRGRAGSASGSAALDRDSKRQWIILGLAFLAFVAAGVLIDAADHVINPENTSRAIVVPTPTPASPVSDR